MPSSLGRAVLAELHNFVGVDPLGFHGGGGGGGLLYGRLLPSCSSTRHVGPWEINNYNTAAVLSALS